MPIATLYQNKTYAMLAAKLVEAKKQLRQCRYIMQHTDEASLSEKVRRFRHNKLEELIARVDGIEYAMYCIERQYLLSSPFEYILDLFSISFTVQGNTCLINQQ